MLNDLSPTISTLAVYERDPERFASRWERSMPEALKHLYRRWIEPGARVLELGCGSGRDARFMAGLGARVTATDGSSAMLEVAARLARAAGADVRFEVLMLPGNETERRSTRPLLKRLNDGCPFDVVSSSGVLQHLDHAALGEAVRLIASLTAPTGTVIVSVPTAHPGGDGRWYSNLPAEHYTALFERVGGFSLVSIAAEAKTGPAETPAKWVSMVFSRPRDHACPTVLERAYL